MKDGCRGGASLCEGFHEGDLGGGLLYWGTQKMRFLQVCKIPCRRVSLFTGTLLGDLEGVCLPGHLRGKKLYRGSFFGPGSIGAFWNFAKGTVLLQLCVCFPPYVSRGTPLWGLRQKDRLAFGFGVSQPRCT